MIETVVTYMTLIDFMIRIYRYTNKRLAGSLERSSERIGRTAASLEDARQIVRADLALEFDESDSMRLEASLTIAEQVFLRYSRSSSKWSKPALKAGRDEPDIDLRQEFTLFARACSEVMVSRNLFNGVNRYLLNRSVETKLGLFWDSHVERRQWIRVLPAPNVVAALEQTGEIRRRWFGKPVAYITDDGKIFARSSAYTFEKSQFLGPNWELLAAQGKKEGDSERYHAPSDAFFVEEEQYTNLLWGRRRKSRAILWCGIHLRVAHRTGDSLRYHPDDFVVFATVVSAVISDIAGYELDWKRKNKLIDAEHAAARELLDILRAGASSRPNGR